MTVRTYLCGTSQTAYHASSEPVRAAAPVVRRPKREASSVRLRTVLHMPGVPRLTRGYRVVAELTDGGQALLCLGRTRQEAVALARQRVAALPATVAAVRLQEWIGGTTTGRWRDVRFQRLRASERPPRRRRSAG